MNNFVSISSRHLCVVISYIIIILKNVNFKKILTRFLLTVPAYYCGQVDRICTASTRRWRRAEISQLYHINMKTSGKRRVLEIGYLRVEQCAVSIEVVHTQKRQIQTSWGARESCFMSSGPWRIIFKLLTAG